MIKFPKLHIAQSAMNRILNVADEIDAGEVQAAPVITPPSLPEADPAGTALDVKLATPPGEVSAPPELAIQDVLGPSSIL